VANQPLIDAIEWTVNATFWAAVLFPVLIGFIWPWWRDWWGQNMISLDLCIAGATFASVLRYDFGVHSIALAWVDVVFLALVFFILVWRCVMIFRTQRAGVTTYADNPAAVPAPATDPASAAE
jgi:hypothetical protein